MLANASSVTTLAKLFEVSERRVQQLAKEAIIPKPERGQYDLANSIRAYIRYLRTRLEGRQLGVDDNSPDLRAERKRLLKAQADKLEMEQQELRRELLPHTLVQELLEDLAILFAANLDAWPGRLAHDLAGLKQPVEVKNKLYSESRQLRSELAIKLKAWAKLYDQAVKVEALMDNDAPV
jgi:phage terminase Nu1 subunit (DNA packaging protein)